ncbi:dTDP-4-keto-6-deoxy-D-glucose aminotransferase [Wigglesworthia glossinidia endosymbiont of Glossina morsitans morsitans (Yale colony)]|uniref:dTDP-4-keto-6-deoxy-D-glucose aminotransferase n=1 Tax=Wigglesworthia glossinidia endosymbiont of Glossina morsitans morsitans (Yale colony) TaxID=1142511 RepID=H6Q515_WIGGL|nr:dTDP-4-amino-4,6-dideoxygalactose transaminase [Wigglesworthia glossinidia]AFA41298.1 dTDP-4-keto-6-deoxy-D-glucose aminotransferase [Wigglesworthia glossinidia endosymbiont of Glossina morsitans morsitans (Yale colony)]
MYKKTVIPFNQPTLIGTEKKYVSIAIKNNTLSGDGEFSHLCSRWLEKNLRVKKVFLTPSCTDALEMAAIILNIQKEDEIIMPSYTFVSTANAFVLRGAKIIFIDIRPDTLNIDEKLIESAITKKTKAIVVIHYGGISCAMDTIKNISKKYKLWIIEDSAQSILAKYKNFYLGSIGHLGCLSFHSTKNLTSGGEGGAILINDESLIERAKIIREKGTNRSLLIEGKIDKYTWHSLGSSYLMSDLQAAYLWAQLKLSENIHIKRMKLWNNYFHSLKTSNFFDIPIFPKYCQHNAHTFYLKFKNYKDCNFFIKYMRKNGINVAQHYAPLHLSPAGIKFGKLFGNDIHTNFISKNLVRLPLFFNLDQKNQKYIICNIHKFINTYKQK